MPRTLSGKQRVPMATHRRAKACVLPPSDHRLPATPSCPQAIMCPVFQALAGFGPVLMHEYEGWQVGQHTLWQRTGMGWSAHTLLAWSFCARGRRCR